MVGDENVTRKIWVPGCTFCNDCDDDPSACNDERANSLSVFFEIPGVKKEDISLKFIKDGMRLEAARDARTQYVSQYSFSCPADIEHVKAAYNEGLLQVDVPLACVDPFDEANTIPIG